MILMRFDTYWTRGAYSKFRSLLAQRNAVDRWHDFESKSDRKSVAGMVRTQFDSCSRLTGQPLRRIPYQRRAASLWMRLWAARCVLACQSATVAQIVKWRATYDVMRRSTQGPYQGADGRTDTGAPTSGPSLLLFRFPSVDPLTCDLPGPRIEDQAHRLAGAIVQKRKAGMVATVYEELIAR